MRKNCTAHNYPVGALNTFSPVADEYMADMNESRRSHELICNQMLEKTEIKLEMDKIQENAKHSKD